MQLETIRSLKIGEKVTPSKCDSYQINEQSSHALDDSHMVEDEV